MPTNFEYNALIAELDRYKDKLDRLNKTVAALTPKCDFIDGLLDVNKCVEEFGCKAEDILKHNAAIREIAATTVDKMWLKLSDLGQCPYPIEHMKGLPIGMHHCPLCGTMVVAGMPHHDIDPPFDPEQSSFAQSFWDEYGEAIELLNQCDRSSEPDTTSGYPVGSKSCALNELHCMLQDLENSIKDQVQNAADFDFDLAYSLAEKAMDKLEGEEKRKDLRKAEDAIKDLNFKEFSARLHIVDLKKNSTYMRSGADDSLQDLTDSIAKIGQLKPIVVNQDLIVLCGWRRVLAHKALGRKMIEATIVPCVGVKAAGNQE